MWLRQDYLWWPYKHSTIVESSEATPNMIKMIIMQGVTQKISQDRSNINLGNIFFYKSMQLFFYKEFAEKIIKKREKQRLICKTFLLLYPLWSRLIGLIMYKWQSVSRQQPTSYTQIIFPCPHLQSLYHTQSWVKGWLSKNISSKIFSIL